MKKSKFNKTKFISLRVTEKQLKLIDETAEKHELKRCEFIREHLINLCEKLKNKI